MRSEKIQTGLYCVTYSPYYFITNNCSRYCHWRLRSTRIKLRRTSSGTMRRRLAAGRTSTLGRCRSVSRCRLGNTCWCPPPSSPTTRQTSWSGCSPRRRLELCECQISSIRTTPAYLPRSCEVLSHREMGSTVDADLPEVSRSSRTGGASGPAGADGLCLLSASSTQPS